MERHGDRAFAPEIRAVVDEVDAEPHSHHDEVDASAKHAQRAARARIGARKTAAAHAAVPGHRGHQHQDADLRGQQQVVGQQARSTRRPCPAASRAAASSASSWPMTRAANNATQVHISSRAARCGV